MPARRSDPARRSSKSALAVMLVDDHPLWRETLRKVIERNGVGEVVAEASDGAAAVQQALSTRLDVVVMDVQLPTIDGVEATRRIRAGAPEVKILVLSSHEARATVVEAVRAGASGYLLKTAGAKEVADAVRRVADGELVFPPELASVVLDEFRRLSDGSERTAAPRVAVAGDSAVHRDGLAHVLAEAGLVVTTSTGDLADLRRNLDTEPPDVLIVDFHSSPDKGLRAAARIRGEHPEIGLLVLGQETESSPAVELLSDATEGIGYLLRDRVANVDELTDAVRRVASGESVIDAAVVNRLVDEPREPKKLKGLTPREREVLALMAEGHSNQAIRERLFLSAKTLEKHVGAIFTKLGLEETGDAHRRVLAVLTYLRSG